MRFFSRRKITCLIISIPLTIFSTQTIASDFNIPFINAAGLGNLYAGWAAIADDASTEYSNPAGLVRIPNQQIVAAALVATGNTKFTGTTTPPFPPFSPQTGTASSKLFGFIPSFYYAAPINDRVVFGVGETVPFALGTNYPKDSIVRYSATKSQITVIDVGPGIGIKITNKLSVGFGLDFDHLALTLNNMIGSPPFIPDSESQNTFSAWGYGWHAGVLYQFTPCTRIGFNYTSQVAIHATGDSRLYSPLVPGGEFKTNNLEAGVKLPALAQLSLYHEINPRWAVMGTVFYTDWSVLKQATFRNVATPTGQTVVVTTPFNYRNTFDYSVGTTFKANQQWLFRAGLEFLGEPSNSRDRLVFDPIGAATIVGLGAHYQQNRCLGYDLSYAHSFFKRTNINHVATFDTETGHSDSYTNVIGAQITWNLT